MVEDVETPKVVVEVLTVTECLLFRERTFFAFQREAYDFVSFIKELFKPGIVPAGFVGYSCFFHEQIDLHSKNYKSYPSNSICLP